MIRACCKSLAAIALALGLQGCNSISYYAQSVNGHFTMIAARQPVEELAADPSRSPEFREQMALAVDIRRFATEQLALPDNGSYRSYVDTHRDFVTWAVFATPEFSLDARTWCFPVFGCVPYRGYFSHAAAEKYAAAIARQGMDTYVGGVTAYSTLGWFSDPLVNTMLRFGKTYIAALVFHELAHQRIYLRDDSAFNEAFAVTVENSGVFKWLKRKGDAAARREYEADRSHERDFVSLVSETRAALKLVYDGPGSEEQKRAAKTAEIAKLRTRYRRIRNGRWRGYRGYDGWFDSPINNAKLSATAIYNDLVPAFVHLLALCSGDYERFYRAVEQIGALGREARAQALKGAKTCG